MILITLPFYWPLTKQAISEPIYEDELPKNLTMKICYEATNTNPNSFYIPIKICLEGYKQYELTTYIYSGGSVYFGKRSLFLEFMWKKAKKSFASTDSWQ